MDWKTCLRVGISIFVLYLCIYYWPQVSALLTTLLGAASPLLVGALIAYVLFKGGGSAKTLEYAIRRKKRIFDGVQQKELQ